MTDGELVQKTLGGQTSAYEELVRRWSARLTAFMRSRVHRTDISEDLAQEVFLRGFRKLATLQTPDKFGSWLLSIAHGAAVDWLKAKSQTEVTMNFFQEGESSAGKNRTREEPTPVENCLAKEQRAMVWLAIEKLPEKLREVLLIYYYDDVTYQELADMLGVSSATINARLTKARAALRASLIALGTTS